MQLQLPQEDIKASAILNQTIVPPTSPEATSVILDIDVFREESVPNDDDELWGYFETLHARKNKIQVHPAEACARRRIAEKRHFLNKGNYQSERAVVSHEKHDPPLRSIGLLASRARLDEDCIRIPFVLKTHLLPSHTR